MEVPTHRLPPRDYQSKIILEYNNPDIDQMLAVIARRGGKTTTIFSECVVPDLVRERQTIVMVYPTAKMGFRNFWNNIENDGFKTIEHIPKALIASQSNSEDDMRIVLINGSVFMVVGSTNVEALRGANGKKYLFDEFADMPIEAVNVVAPIIEANGGKMIFMGTPKLDGVNGETMRRMHESFKTDKTGTKYTCYVKATEYMTPEQLEKSRQGYILRNGNDFKFKQEMLLDWGQSSSSSYYGSIMAAKDIDGTIGNYPHNPSHPVYTAWDLGRADNMAIVFFQYYNKKVRIIDSYETQNFGLNTVIPFMKTKPYNYGWHFLPWDGTVHSANDNVTRIDYMHSLGFVNASTLRKEGVTQGINRVLEGLPKALINAGTCTELVRKLRIYKRKFNPITGDYVGPDHKSESHMADAIRYTFNAIDTYFDKKTGEFLYSPGSEQETYESDLVTVPFY